MEEGVQTNPATVAYNRGGVVIDSLRRTVEYQGKTISLTRRQFDILASIASRDGVSRRGVVLADVYGENSANKDKSFKVLLCNLRKILRAAGVEWRIETVPGGYSIRQ